MKYSFSLPEAPPVGREDSSDLRGTIPRQVVRYREKYALDKAWPLVSGDLACIDQVVALPVLAEREHLFSTLACLSRNSGADLRRTLVICVVNNRRPHLAEPGVIENNQETLRGLDALVRGWMPEEPFLDISRTNSFREILAGGLRVAYIDASSGGCEMPDRGGGVGMARKIAMDKSLAVFDYSNPSIKLIFCLDADTLVENNYLSAVRAAFEAERIQAGVVAHSHRGVSDPLHSAAIRSYEIFLRYYVLGLGHAGSPYAFHTIGSTMICTAESYVAVSGMNIRDAAEDFYFLTKLAKVGKVGAIGTTSVSPSARRSTRVPFGTGRQMIRFLEEGKREYLLYDPQVFRILKEWLDSVSASPDREGAELQMIADAIDPGLGDFLRVHRFGETWDKIRGNCRSSAVLKRQFASWFDGFKTMKLIHFLTEGRYPRINMFAAVEELLEMMKQAKLAAVPPAFRERNA